MYRKEHHLSSMAKYCMESMGTVPASILLSVARLPAMLRKALHKGNGKRSETAARILSRLSPVRDRWGFCARWAGYRPARNAAPASNTSRSDAGWHSAAGGLITDHCLLTHLHFCAPSKAASFFCASLTCLLDG